MLQTWLTDRFDLSVPVVSAPMHSATNGRFAAAVSSAGALGTFSVYDQPADKVREEAAAAAGSGSAYGAGLLAWQLAKHPHLVDVVRELHPALVSVSFGDYERHVRPLQEAGIVVATQVGTLLEAPRRRGRGRRRDRPRR